MSRSTNNQPFCWQEKKVLRLLRKNYKGGELAKLRNLYLTITEIDSDFNQKDVKYYTKTIATYSGLHKDWIPKGLRIFQKLKIINVESNREDGRFAGKTLQFTPEKVQEIDKKSTVTQNTVTVKTVTGKTVTGNPPHKKIFSLEDSLCKEDSLISIDSTPEPTTLVGKIKEYIH